MAARAWIRPLRRLSIARLTWILFTLGVCWRLARYLLNFPLWGDESFVAINLLERDFASLLEPLEYGQIVPVGLLWLQLALTRVLDSGEWALRLLPVLAGLASLGLLWWFVRPLFDRRAVLLIVGIFAASYYPVRHAAELKPYATDLLVSLCLTASAWAVHESPASLRRWAILTAGLAVAPWLSYPSVFVAGAIGLLLIHRVMRTPSRAGAAGLAVSGLVCVASLVAIFHLYVEAHLDASSGDVAWIAERSPTWSRAFPPLREPWRLPLWLLETHTGRMMAYPNGDRNGGSTGTLLLVVIGCVVLWRSSRRALLFLMFAPLAFHLIAAAMHAYPYGTTARLSLYMAPSFCTLAGLGLATALRKWLPKRRSPAAIRVASCVLALLIAGGFARDLARPYKSPQDRAAREAYRALMEDVASRDRVILFLARWSAPHAPNAYRGGGTAAQLWYYVTRDGRQNIEWAPPADTVRPHLLGDTWLVVLRDAERPFPEERIAAYVEVVSGSLGEPTRRLHVLSPNCSIEVFRFPRPSVRSTRIRGATETTG